jgi:hypothetical protein
MRHAAIQPQSRAQSLRSGGTLSARTGSAMPAVKPLVSTGDRDSRPYPLVGIEPIMGS